MEKIKEYLKKKIDEGRLIGYTLGIFDFRGEKFLLCDGFLSLEPQKRRAKKDTIYDIASITKPIITASLIFKLIENNEINLDDKIEKFFRDLPSDKKEITVKELLTHTSGIIEWEPLYRNGEGFKRILHSAFFSKVPYKKGYDVRYSCINYIILKGIIEKVTQQKYIELAEKLIITPSSSDDTFFNPPVSLKFRISPTERGNQYEKRLAKKFFNLELKVREHLIWGEVHDGNSFYGGGTSGNSGLFSTVDDLYKIAMYLLKSFFKDEKILNFYTLESLTPENSKIKRSGGFILKTTEESFTAEQFSSKTFYHRGFTGTSLTVDPEKELVFVFLSNRVHPYVRNGSVKDIILKVQEIFFENYY